MSSLPRPTVVAANEASPAFARSVGARLQLEDGLLHGVAPLRARAA